MRRSIRTYKPDELADILGLILGAVTPFGLLNEEGIGLIGIHPNDNTATVWLKAEELIKIIQDHGNEVNVVKL